ncbi:hypothetical protein PVNG_05967 [Plasmodium vivax North Korean]|uniref:Fam-l protein n=1 Tax=Plasmodium vivax North Korean TaxID=1035514 RepID=A0A0J9U0Y9_PLAVI|nr:hypothetical protein PVNG_05967 [Plasmodium vivax North Korean]
MNINFNRLLARHELKSELGYSSMREKISDHSVVGKKKIIPNQMSINSQLRGKRLNYIDIYIKDYEKRYRKKKGISKLDCYCEKKVFEKIHNLYEFGKNLQNKKRSKKYVIVLTLILFIPAAGLIFPILFGSKNLWNGTIDYCLHDGHKNAANSHSGCSRYDLTDSKYILESFGEANYVIFSIIDVFYMLLFIYILIKVIKYKRLRSGR